MEDDDEFGDLYTDVITSFPASSPFQSHQLPSQSESAPPPIEINPPAAAAAATTPSTLPSEGSDLLLAPSNSTSHPNLNINLNRDPKPNLNLPPEVQANGNNISQSRGSEDPPILEGHEFGEVSANSPSGEPRVETAKARVLEIRDFNLNTEAAATDHEDNDDEDDGPVIPGISIAQPKDGALNIPNGVSQPNDGALNHNNVDPGDDWESDSDDDLQILLNGNGHPDIHQFQGPMGMADNEGKVGDDDDEDEDGEPLVIVSPPEEQVWGEDAGQAPDGERKETGEAGKANGGASLPPKGGYNSYGYHQYHSQFKYVRPGATPLPGGIGGAGQVRPPINMGSVGGRGRGDWRQAGMKGSLQKGGFWGSNASGRGSGGDFILPSHKTIFDINIDSFEEKPWNHPGADISDFFNFGLSEDSWKEYCRKLEQLRMESTMKNKSNNVLVVGSQQEQEYDPDLPPELAAAAAAIQDSAAENSNALKADLGPNDIGKGNALMRPPLPIGRPIQVETGSGERLPSMDNNRPPRMRDLYTVIEIVLQGSLDDDTSADCGAIDKPDNDALREDLRDDAVEEDGEQTRNEYSDGSPQSLDRKKREDNDRRPPRANASHDNVTADEESLPPEAPIEHSPGSRENSPVYTSDKFEASDEERRMEGKVHERSRSTSPGESALDGRSIDDKQRESSESMERKDSPHGSSFEERAISDDEPIQTEGNCQKEKEGAKLGTAVSSSTLDTSKHHSMRKLGSQVERMSAKEIDYASYIKAARSGDNSRATGSSRDLHKGNNIVDCEGNQDEHFSHARDLKRNRREDVQSHHRKDRDGSLETEKNNTLAKRREGSYLHRESVPYSPQSSHVKSEGFDRRRERDYADAMLPQRGEDPHSRMYRAPDLRKHEHADGMMARQRGKVREGERSNKDEYLPSRKLLESGNLRGHHEKDAGFRIKEKDDILKTGYENMDDPHSKRRKDDEHARRDHLEKGEIFRTNRDSSSHRKRERDESLDQRRRDDLRRRENTDDHRSIIRSKDGSWLQRERVEQRHRERDDGPRSKQSFLESSSRREREDGRPPIKSGRNVEDKGRVSHSRKDEFKGYDRDGPYKDTGRNGEQLKRKDKVENAGTLHYGYEEKRSRQEKPTGRSGNAVHASDNQNVHGRRSKENSRKSNQLEGGQQTTSNSSKKPREEKSGRNEMAELTGTTEEGNAEYGNSVQLQTTQEKMGNGSDDEQHRSKRGRSKLERWASHEERDNSFKNKPSSLKLEAEKDNLEAGHSAKVSDEPAKKSQAVDNSHPAIEGKESGTPKEQEADTKQMDNRHLDTVAKLKKRSERFKLPMPSEKDITTAKKMESESLSSAPSEALADAEMKQERPPRKRRWISN